MNIGGVLLLRFIGSLEQSAAAQAAYAVGYTELFSLITWTSVGLMGASATIAGQNLGAGNPDRAFEGVRVASRIGLGVAAVIGLLFVMIPRYLLALFGMADPLVLGLGRSAAAVSQRLRLVHHRRVELHRRSAGHRRHAQPALHLDRVAGRRAARPLCRLPGDARSAADGHLDGDCHRPLHARPAERDALPPGKWRSIAVDIEPARP